MNSLRTTVVRRRRRALLVLTPLLVLVPLLTPMAQAAKPSPAPAISIVVRDILSSVQTPQTAGSPAVFIARDEAFAVVVDFLAGDVPTAISTNRAVTLEVSVAAGASAFSTASQRSVTVPAGATSATFPDLELTEAANGVELLVRATAPSRVVEGVVPGRSPVFDVAKDFAAYDIINAAKDGASVSREGAGVACSATPERPTCADLVLPASPNNGDRAFFSTGVCDASVGCAPERDVLQVLAAFELTRSNPATLVVKCDKSLCGGGAIGSKVLKVSLSATGPLQNAGACASKGVVDDGLEFCVDYVQSRRDGSGDTYFYLLLLRDARMSI
jgi:hypothetical protein